MIFVYILFSDPYNRFYVGITKDVNERLKKHNKGLVKPTKPFLPWRVVHTEKYNDYIEARKREKYLKSAAGRKWRKNNLGM